ncbi:Retrovirus-related Pol polyprotein from transposon TNT 1-94 [Sesamum angolense]|uniref:Retrovirus-related Pol polyprotein from transposon TNT 1-94 n=1 Tax=Sesamum angolense TaxID=2727404 RepID=A0AAE2BQM1_9LAMI|nr:Retrovirus-related Pol polyprotein from transposon TNT 1-94 [Sesamum angolense]
MRHGIKLSKKQPPKTDEEFTRMLDIPYASTVGSIQYVVQCTRPDIAYALSVTSRYQACTGEAQWSTVKTILSSKQATIADSTMETEYIAASLAAKKAVKWEIVRIGVKSTELTRGDPHMEALEASSSKYVVRTMSSKKRIRPLSLHDRGFSYALGDATTLRLVQDGNRHQIPCPRARSGDGRLKDRTLMNSKPKSSYGNSPSL